jgi:ABC-type glycerol-3-phosphate transport system substrate-binding protein
MQSALRLRAAAGAVCAFLLVWLVAGCGGGGADKAGNAGQGGGSAGPTGGADGNTDREDIVEITVWDQPKADSITKPVIDEIHREFEQKYPNIKVIHELPPAGTNDREVFVTAMAGGNGPDAYSEAHFPIIGDWVRQGFAADLTSYWNEHSDKDHFISSAMEAATIDGKIYGVPHNMYVMGLLYNKKLFEEAGLDPDKPPADWDEFVDYAKRLTKPEKNQYGYTILGMEWADWWFEYYVWQAGGDLTTRNPDGTVTLDFSKPPAVTALQFYKDLKWTHKVVQSNVVQSFQDNQNDFFQGRSAMILGASDWFGGLVQNGMDLNDVGFAPFPVGPSGKGPSQTGGAYWIVNPKSSKEKQDAAFKYIAYMTSREVIEKKMKFEADNGIFPNLLSVRSDIDPVQFTANVPADLVAGVKKASESTQLEYFLKERLTPYVVKAIQKVLVDETADPLTELKAAEELAQREVVDPYNQEIKQAQ